MSLVITSHAQQRSAQRALPLRDMDLLLLVASEVEDGFLVREKDYQVFEKQMRDLVRRVGQWRGARLVVEDGHVVTAYRPCRRKHRQLLREAKAKHR